MQERDRKFYFPIYTYKKHNKMRLCKTRSRNLVDARYKRIRVSRVSFLSRSRFYCHPKELLSEEGYSVRNVHPQATRTKYQVIPQGETSFLNVACAPRTLQWAKLRIIWHLILSARPWSRSELELQRLVRTFTTVSRSIERCKLSQKWHKYIACATQFFLLEFKILP